MSAFYDTFITITAAFVLSLIAAWTGVLGHEVFKLIGSRFSERE
jgi:hypothetical protein